MNKYKRFLKLSWLPFLMCAALWPSQANAGSTSLGPRAMFSKPNDADEGEWHGGAQLRLRGNRAWAVEGSIDYRRNDFGSTRVDVYPVQASLLAYLAPEQPVSPFLLAGGGWYYTRIKSSIRSDTDHRFGPHVGGGLEWFMNKFWSLDSSYRYIWLSDINSQDAEHPLGRDLDDQGYMVTIGLNYHFP